MSRHCCGQNLVCTLNFVAPNGGLAHYTANFITWESETGEASRTREGRHLACGILIAVHSKNTFYLLASIPRRQPAYRGPAFSLSLSLSSVMVNLSSVTSHLQQPKADGGSMQAKPAERNRRRRNDNGCKVANTKKRPNKSQAHIPVSG